MAFMIYDTIIIGSGPAGLTAAIYCARDNLKTLVFAGGKWGGQLMLTTEVDNFPGFPKGIMGPELMNNMKVQAERFGVEIKLTDVSEVDFSKKPFSVNGLETKTVIIATGADTVWLGVPGEDKLIGKGVSSCAPCDAFFFKDKKVIVVGGGDSAMEEAVVLSKFASYVTIVHRRDTFRASEIMQERVKNLPNVDFRFSTEIEEILGEEKVTGVKFRNGDKYDCDGVFVAIGHTPNTKLFQGVIELDPKGYIKKGGVGKGEIYKMMTSTPGVFVAGDVHDHHYQQAVTAAAFGCMAALDAGRYIEGEKSVDFYS